jgi:Uma2 family endonuclease
MASVPVSPLSEEEYLHLERNAEIKSEFFDGHMFAMAVGSFNHSQLGAQIAVVLAPRIQKGCRVFNSDMRIKIGDAGLYTYSDGGVVCGEPQFADRQRDILLNPVLIVEVLSPSSERYDRGKKFALYRTIPSFLEYLIIHQGRRHVEHYSKQEDGSWVLREYSGEGSVQIARWRSNLPLAEIYAAALDLS